MAAKDDYLMDTLIDMGLITQEQVDEASGEVTDTHGVIDVLVAKGELFEESVTMAKATQAGLGLTRPGPFRPGLARVGHALPSQTKPCVGQARP